MNPKPLPLVTERTIDDPLAGKAMSGVWAASLTPLDRNLNVDPVRFVDHAHHLLENGCHGVVMFGSTGEAPSFSIEERMALLDAALRAGLPAQRMLIGTGCCALSDTVRLTRHALQGGCRRVLMLPPFYFKNVGADALFRCYAEVFDRIGANELQVMLYHFPKLSAVPILPEVIERLVAAYPGTVIGMKDSAGDRDAHLELCTRFPQLSILPGSEVLLADSMAAGGAGCISATANINAAGIRRAFEAGRAGDPAVVERQTEIAAARHIVERAPMVPGLKHVIAGARRDPAWLTMRPPFMPVERDVGDAMARDLAAAGVRIA